MRITKYQHACIVLEDQGQKIIIDPGNRGSDFGSLKNVLAVVVTHIHPDHFYPAHIKEIIDSNPAVQIFTTQEVRQSFNDPHVTAVKDGDEYILEPFTLHFTGSLHATVHPNWPSTVQNIGVRVNDVFYYGGDSFTPPDKPIKVLAVPVSYAWARMDEVLDFVANIKPNMCFPTHNDQLSESGNATANKWVAKMCDEHSIDFISLAHKDFMNI